MKVDKRGVYCLNTIVGIRAHRNSGQSLYNRWKHIRERCTNPKRKDYKYYGAKGIRICEEWHCYESFHRWFFDSILKYANDNNVSVNGSSLVVDRIDPHGDYCPSNCRLITASENSKRVVHKKGKTK